MKPVFTLEPHNVTTFNHIKSKLILHGDCFIFRVIFFINFNSKMLNYQVTHKKQKLKVYTL